jgi:hypothetical protein
MHLLMGAKIERKFPALDPQNCGGKNGDFYEGKSNAEKGNGAQGRGDQIDTYQTLTKKWVTRLAHCIPMLSRVNRGNGPTVF